VVDNTLCYLLSHRKLSIYDQWSGMVVHVAMDSTVIVDDIRKFICMLYVCLAFIEMNLMCICVHITADYILI